MKKLKLQVLFANDTISLFYSTLSGASLHKSAAPQPQHQVDSRIHLNVVVGESATTGVSINFKNG